MSNPYLYAIDFPKQYEHKDIDIIHLFYKKKIGMHLIMSLSVVIKMEW